MLVAAQRAAGRAERQQHTELVAEVERVAMAVHASNRLAVESGRDQRLAVELAGVAALAATVALSLAAIVGGVALAEDSPVLFWVLVPGLGGVGVASTFAVARAEWRHRKASRPATR